ncbi:MAG: CDP-alcohol phosphatidyltransferase family protein [Flavobacterium sp.]|nr:CDP-alcohol phosphatidyltransferase family protein [Flavobacterium sp.]MBP8156779.1 CDP-alcohol phosphatidyltransferase family protein [Flavobacterium sp.]
MTQPAKYDWMFFQSVILLTGAVVDFWFAKLFFCPLFGLLVFIGLLLTNRKNYTIHHKWGGLPNTITLFRLLLLFAVPFIESAFSLGILCLIVVSLDGLDGFAARKLNQATEFGAVLDMETDAFFCLLFSLTIAIQNPDLYWIIIGGLLRYLYKIITTLISKNGYTESKKNYARYIAGGYFLSFILYFFIPDTIGKTCITIGTLMIVFSFAVSFYEFLTHKQND